MKNTNEKINAKEYEAVELTDEELAKVVGGADLPGSSCTHHYTACTEANCLNPSCIHLVQDGDVCSCGNDVSGSFKVIEVGIGGIGGIGSSSNSDKLVKL